MSRENRSLSDSDDDDSDSDYIPDGAENEAASEAESEGEAESEPEEKDEDGAKRKGSRAPKGGEKRRRKMAKKLTNLEEEEEGKREVVEKGAASEEEEKKRADSLWADFTRDTGAESKARRPEPADGGRETSWPAGRATAEEKVKITKIFEFAGEEVRVEKEVAMDSAEARLSLPENKDSIGRSSGGAKGSRRGAGSAGISSVLGLLGKKAKISTLEKSKLDWDSFKKEEKLEEEISSHNKGRDGYLERQDFLRRADLRQFEIEKELRATGRRGAR